MVGLLSMQLTWSIRKNILHLSIFKLNEMIEFEYRETKPVLQLTDFVESFWMLINPAEEERYVVVVPDSRIDISFSYSSDKPYHVTLNDLESVPIRSVVLPKTVIFAISFNLRLNIYLMLRFHL